MKPDKFSFRARLASFRFAFSGLASLLKYEHNSRIHLVSAVAVLATGLLLKISLTEWCILIIVTGLVFITELINSAIEAIADHSSKEYNELIRKAKDYSAAAVLIAALSAVACGLVIFIPKIAALLTNR